MANAGWMFSILVDLGVWTAAMEAAGTTIAFAEQEAIRASAAVVEDIAKSWCPTDTGRLAGSISRGPMLDAGNHSYHLFVGPRNAPMYLYSGKEEQRAGYMRAGADAAGLSAFLEKAVGAALAGWA